MVTKFTVVTTARRCAWTAWMLFAILFSAPQILHAQSFTSDSASATGFFSGDSTSFGLSSPTDVSFQSNGSEPFNSSTIDVDSGGGGSLAGASVGTDLLIGGLIIGTIVLVDHSSSHHSSQNAPAPELNSLASLSLLLGTALSLIVTFKRMQDRQTH